MIEIFLRNTVIPPPMASVGIQFPAAIRTVSFLDGEDVEGVAVWLASGNIGVALCADGDHWEDLETDLEVRVERELLTVLWR